METLSRKKVKNKINFQVGDLIIDTGELNQLNLVIEVDVAKAFLTLQYWSSLNNKLIHSTIGTPIARELITNGELKHIPVCE